MKAASTETDMIRTIRQYMFYTVVDRETHVDKKAVEFNGTPWL